MYELKRSSPGSGFVELALLLILISAFVTVVTVIYVVRTFVKYSTHMSLWIALAVSVGLTLCVDLKNRDTLMRENINLIDEVLHKPWWGSEDKPLQEQEIEQVAA